LQTGRTGLFQGHSTAGLAVAPAAALPVADLPPGVRREHPEPPWEREVAV